MNALDRRMLAGADLREHLQAGLEAATAPIPLLVLRLPEFAEIAWRDGKRAAQRVERMTVRAFASAAGRIIRDGDLLGHDERSDWFAVAMLSPARDGNTFSAFDARSVLERIAATISMETGRRMECGWLPLQRASEVTDLSVARERALERGARERERFEFFATVGHELRTPLTSIRGYIETLLDDDVDPQTSRRFLETARREALRLARLVDGMLEFSLLDTSPVHSGETDIVHAVHGAVDTLLPVAREAGVTLAANATGVAHARIDADGCMHALLNVIENGVKYARRNGTVKVSVAREDGFVCISVDDDGPGVAPVDRDRIFVYRDRGNAAATVPGKGVGLAIVRTIVERSGGRVSVSSSPLGGARFTVAFPEVRPKAEFAPRLS